MSRASATYHSYRTHIFTLKRLIVLIKQQTYIIHEEKFILLFKLTEKYKHTKYDCHPRNENLFRLFLLSIRHYSGTGNRFHTKIECVLCLLMSHALRIFRVLPLKIYNQSEKNSRVFSFACCNSPMKEKKMCVVAAHFCICNTREKKSDCT